MPFETNVFINCPFDKEYAALLRALTFTLLYLKFNPKLAQTISSSTIRINQIKQHIRTSRYGIHDLSRSKPMKLHELPRLNMSYELGLDIGCAEYGGKKFKTKRALILETERYHYHKVLSDISGQDIESHNDEPKTLILKVRNWISNSRVILSPGIARSGLHITNLILTSLLHFLQNIQQQTWKICPLVITLNLRKTGLRNFVHR